jgi:FecR-like protein
MKTRIPHSNLVVALILMATLLIVCRFVFAATQRQARVTEVIREVNVLGAQAAARPAVVNETVHEGSAVRTGSESRAELTFVDQTITRLGANTVFSVGGAARTYDLGSGAILISAPKGVGTVKVSAGVATCAVSGFTGIWETHPKGWQKILLIEGDLDGWLNRNAGDKRHMHSRQMLVFPWNAKVLPQPQEFDVCKIINSGFLITGFKTKLPSFPLMLAQCNGQQNQPRTTNLVDPMNQNIVDQSVNARPTEHAPEPRPTIIPSGTKF